MYGQCPHRPVHPTAHGDPRVPVPTGDIVHEIPIRNAEISACYERPLILGKAHDPGIHADAERRPSGSVPRRDIARNRFASLEKGASGDEPVLEVEEPERRSIRPGSMEPAFPGLVLLDL